MESPKAVVYNTDEKGRLEVDFRHNYSNRCRCESCLQMFLAISEGVVIVKSHDNQHAMALPKKTATLFTPIISITSSLPQDNGNRRDNKKSGKGNTTLKGEKLSITGILPPDDQGKGYR